MKRLAVLLLLVTQGAFASTRIADGIYGRGCEFVVDRGKLRVAFPSSCAYFDRYGLRNVPQLGNLQAFDSNGQTACAIDENGLKCWGQEEQLFGHIPTLTNPKAFAVGVQDACAIDDKGISCWSRWNPEWPKPTFENPKAVVVHTEGACAIDDRGAQCWGFGPENDDRSDLGRRRKYFEQRFSKGPRPLTGAFAISMSVGSDIACALDKMGAACWGPRATPALEAKLKTLKNPKQIFLGYSLCVVDDEGGKCWSLYPGNFPSIRMPDLKNPRYVDAGLLGSGWGTALDDSGIIHWKLEIDEAF